MFKKFSTKSSKASVFSPEPVSTPETSDSSSADEGSSDTASTDYASQSYDSTPSYEPEPVQRSYSSHSSAPSYSAVGAGARNVLSSDVEIKGNIRFRNELLIDGKIEGRIDSEGDLTVGQNAEVNGEIRTKSVVIQGKVTGDITVEDRAELQTQAQVLGDLRAAKLVIQEGATFVGRSEVNPSGIPVPASEASKEGKITSFTSR